MDLSLHHSSKHHLIFSLLGGTVQLPPCPSPCDGRVLPELHRRSRGREIRRDPIVPAAAIFFLSPFPLSLSSPIPTLMNGCDLPLSPSLQPSRIASTARKGPKPPDLSISLQIHFYICQTWRREGKEYIT